eukprot:contig_24732_g6106
MKGVLRGVTVRMSARERRTLLHAIGAQLTLVISLDHAWHWLACAHALAGTALSVTGAAKTVDVKLLIKMSSLGAAPAAR